MNIPSVKRTRRLSINKSVRTLMRATQCLDKGTRILCTVSKSNAHCSRVAFESYRCCKFVRNSKMSRNVRCLKRLKLKTISTLFDFLRQPFSPRAGECMVSEDPLKYGGKLKGNVKALLWLLCSLLTVALAD